MKKLKKIVRKLPFVSQTAKFFYDLQKEKSLERSIKKFLQNKSLPYTKEAPKFYSVGYEPTIRCNLKCKMCYQKETRLERKEELTPDEALIVCDKLKEKTKDIKLVGGEPLLRSDIFSLIDFWNRAGKRVFLQTNCTLIDKENVLKLKNLKNISDIATSLDGPPEIHNVVRGVPYAFSRLENAIELLRDFRPDIPITIFSTLLLNDNIDHFYKLIDTCKKLKIGSINVLFEQVYRPEDVEQTRKIFQQVFGWGENDYRLNTQTRENLFSQDLIPSVLKRKLFELRFYGLKRGCFVNFTPFNYYLNLDKYLNEKPSKVFCLKLLNPELRINQKGEVVWCDIIEKSFGSLLEKTPDEIWLSDEYQKFRKYLSQNSLPICHRCCKASYLK